MNYIATYLMSSPLSSPKKLISFYSISPPPEYRKFLPSLLPIMPSGEPAVWEGLIP